MEWTPPQGDSNSWVRLRSALRATLCYIWRKHLHNLRQFPWRLVTLADDEATPEEKNQVKEAWSGTNECCLPQGMARNWMAAGVDLDCPNILRFLHWLAFMTRMTVADIEVRHARNNQTAGTSGNLDFSQVVSEYIATEFSELVRSNVLSSVGPEALEQHAAPAPALPPAAAGPRLRKQRRVDGGPPLRGKSALHCFASDRRLGHLKGGGAFTADCWEKSGRSSMLCRRSAGMHTKPKPNTAIWQLGRQGLLPQPSRNLNIHQC